MQTWPSSGIGGRAPFGHYVLIDGATWSASWALKGLLYFSSLGGGAMVYGSYRARWKGLVCIFLS